MVTVSAADDNPCLYSVRPDGLLSCEVHHCGFGARCREPRTLVLSVRRRYDTGDLVQTLPTPPDHDRVLTGWPSRWWLLLPGAVAVAHVGWRGQQHAARWALAQATGDLTAKPLAVKLANEVGFWALWALLATLAVTPLVRLQRRGGLTALSGSVQPAIWRRTLGLLSAILAGVHMAVYGLLHPKSLYELASIWLDLPWQWLGTVAALLLLPLALTSNQLAMRRLGRRWKSLHKLVYPATIAIVLHYALRSDATQWHWMSFAAIAAGLLALRLGHQR